MKVCHLSSVHVLHDTRILHKECRGLASRGHEVHLVIQHDRNEVIDGVAVHGVPPVRSRLRRMTGATLAVYRKALALDADIYHFHDLELIPAGLMLALIHRKRVVYDVHEDNPETVLSRRELPALIRHPVSWAVRTVERLSSRAFDAVVTVTPAIDSRFRRYTSRTLMVRNFPELDGDDKPSGDWGAREDAVVYIGSITRYRGVMTMLDALARVNERRDVRLLLAGRFAPPELEEEVRALPVNGHIDYRGFVDREEASALMGRARAGLVVLPPDPRYMVSYPTKLFEYMGAGLPVVASDFPVWREIVDGAGCGLLVDPTDPDAIAAAIMSILGNPEGSEEMGRRGRAAALEHYRWENELDRLCSLYDNLAGPGGADGRENAGTTGSPGQGA